jgi:hypothetical protein
MASRMNLNPGGKQPKMRDGWYMKDGKRVKQAMSFDNTHQTHPGMPKGMKEVLKERSLWPSERKLLMYCHDCDPSNTSCCARRILEHQPDFKSQRSLVQEIIEDAGHLCLILPKFHCELNAIEFVWGSAKRWLRENCDYTFKTLQQNTPKAIASVPLSRIRKFQNRVFRWIEAYEGVSQLKRHSLK